MSLPDELEHFIRSEMMDEFYERVELNAATMNTQGGTPWPEELERPGWGHRVLPRGLRQYDLPVSPDLTEAPMEGADATDADLELETETVEPKLTAHVETMYGEWWVGLGWHVPSRELLVFHELEKRHF